ncbi:hypothetical protein EJ110_NYTH06980 [Nymphaea thermarum]|nr:hypothetical protein EJ110_NYTH06980 [Nymphaea thermarum]
MDMLKDVPLALNLTAISKLSLETCPEGTVPIFRGPQDPNLVTKSSGSLPRPQYSTAGHEVSVWYLPLAYAVVATYGSKYHGSYGILNLWNPRVDANEVGFSLGQLWAASDINGAANTVEAGWHVSTLTTLI